MYMDLLYCHCYFLVLPLFLGKSGAEPNLSNIDLSYKTGLYYAFLFILFPTKIILLRGRFYFPFMS